MNVNNSGHTVIRDKTLTHIAGVELSETNSSAVKIPFTLPISSEDEDDSVEKDEGEESLDAGCKNAQIEDTSYLEQSRRKRRSDVAELKNSSSRSSACDNQDHPLPAIPNKKPKMTFSKTSDNGHKTVVNHFYF